MDDTNFNIPRNKEEYLYIDKVDEEDEEIREPQEHMLPDIDDYDTDTVDKILNMELLSKLEDR